MLSDTKMIVLRAEVPLSFGPQQRLVAAKHAIPFPNCEY